MTYYRTSKGSITVQEDGSVVVVRSLPGTGMFLSIELTAEEVQKIKEMIDVQRTDQDRSGR